MGSEPLSLFPTPVTSVPYSGRGQRGPITRSLFSLVVVLQKLLNKESIEPASLTDTLLGREVGCVTCLEQASAPQGAGLPRWPSALGVVWGTLCLLALLFPSLVTVKTVW